MQENEGFRYAFYKRGGLGVLQHALSRTKAAGAKLRRRALTLIGDLAQKVKVILALVEWRPEYSDTNHPSAGAEHVLERSCVHHSQGPGMFTLCQREHHGAACKQSGAQFLRIYCTYSNADICKPFCTWS